MLPVHCVPQTESLYSNRIQPALYVSQPESADHAQRTGETELVQQRRACCYQIELIMLFLNVVFQILSDKVTSVYQVSDLGDKPLH